MENLYQVKPDGKDQIPELDKNGNPKFYVYITQGMTIMMF